MNHEQAFFEDICKNPDDDTPRLIFADWLDDHGQPERAELIRLQCQRAAREGDSRWLRLLLEHRERIDRNIENRPFLEVILDACQTDELRAEVTSLEARERPLAETCRASSFPDLPFDIHFDRGFPAVLEITVQQYLDYADVLEQIAPRQVVRLSGLHLDYEDYPDEEQMYEQEAEFLERLAACPGLERWVELDFTECPGWDRYEILMMSTHLKNLERLLVMGNETGPYITEIAWEHLNSLRWLEFFDSNSAAGRPGSDEFSGFVTDPHLAPLEYLGFGSNSACDEGMEALVQSDRVSRLHSLDLCGNGVSPVGIGYLSRATNLPSLRFLDLSCQHREQLGDASLAELSQAPWFSQLAYFDFSHNDTVSDQGIAKLASSSAIRGLTGLVVGNGYNYGQDDYQALMTEDSLRYLADSRHLGGLRRLSVTNVPISDDTARRIVDSRHLRSLRKFRVTAGPDLTPVGRDILRERFGDGLTLGKR